VLTGSADPRLLARGAATMDGFDTEPLKLLGVETLQIVFEMAREGAQALLPPALHPTLPPLVTWWVQRIADSPWGAFQIAQCRIECRSGLRPRGFLCAGVADHEAASAALARRWGYRLRAGAIHLDRSYHEIRAAVRCADRPILEAALRDPMPLRSHDAYYVASMHLAHTPRGLRLVQVDPEFEVERAERGRPVIAGFDAAGWSADGVRPTHPVSASFSLAAVTLPALRYVCRPDVLAFEGTERVDQQAGPP
jgi:hypothetical protein